MPLFTIEIVESKDNSSPESRQSTPLVQERTFSTSNVREKNAFVNSLTGGEKPRLDGEPVDLYVVDGKCLVVEYQTFDENDKPVIKVISLGKP